VLILFLNKANLDINMLIYFTFVKNYVILLIKISKPQNGGYNENIDNRIFGRVC